MVEAVSEEIFITIVGAGVVGCSIAFELSKDISREIVVIERNEQIRGENQSSRNSGVIHAGIYYPNDFGPLKSRFCVDGNNLLYDFCSKHKIPHKKTGKLVVATSELEEEYLEDVYKIAIENQVPDVRYISSKEIKKYEPNVYGLSALYVPTTGIVEPTSLVFSLYKLAEENGVIFLTGNKVVEIEQNRGFFNVGLKSRTGLEKFRSKILINSAGLYSDEIVKMINPESPFEIEPVKGEWAKFYSTKRKNIGMSGFNVYPVPSGYLPNGEKLNVPFKDFERLFKENKVTKSVGVHLSPTFDLQDNNYIIGNTFTIGPAYSKPENKEDYKYTRNEKYFLDMVLPFFPNLKLEDISLHQTGIRAKLKNHYDFIIERDNKYPHCINLIGIDSPGLTSCLAIAKYVKNLVKELI